MKDTTLQERQARAEEILETSKSGKGSLDGSATRFRTDPPGWQRHRNRLSKDLFEICCDSQAVEFCIGNAPPNSEALWRTVSEGDEVLIDPRCGAGMGRD